MSDKITQFPIKRYMLFSFETYYPGGGMADCLGWSDEISILKTLAETPDNILALISADYCYILDTETGEEIDLK